MYLCSKKIQFCYQRGKELNCECQCIIISYGLLPLDRLLIIVNVWNSSERLLMNVHIVVIKMCKILKNFFWTHIL